MNTRVRQFSDSRWFQIGMLAALALALMIGAAYFFGTGLRADTAKSVAASPIGSSLSNVRESSSVAASPIGSSLTAIRESRLDDYYGRFGNSAAAETASRGNIAPARVNLPSADYARLGSLTPAEAKSLGNIAPARVNLPSADYARLGSLTAAEAASLGNIAPAATADPYQNEWMGFTSPESVGARLSVAPDPATDSSTSIKPEGINPSGAVDSASKQYPWIKPEGIK